MIGGSSFIDPATEKRFGKGAKMVITGRDSGFTGAPAVVQRG
jgi:hypothetical protein